MNSASYGFVYQLIGGSWRILVSLSLIKLEGVKVDVIAPHTSPEWRYCQTYIPGAKSLHWNNQVWAEQSRTWGAGPELIWSHCSRKQSFKATLGMLDNIATTEKLKGMFLKVSKWFLGQGEQTGGRAWPRLSTSTESYLWRSGLCGMMLWQKMVFPVYVLFFQWPLLSVIEQ